MSQENRSHLLLMLPARDLRGTHGVETQAGDAQETSQVSHGSADWESRGHWTTVPDNQNSWPDSVEIWYWINVRPMTCTREGNLDMLLHRNSHDYMFMTTTSIWQFHHPRLISELALCYPIRISLILIIFDKHCRYESFDLHSLRKVNPNFISNTLVTGCICKDNGMR